MIEVTFKIIPHGDKEKEKIIGRLEIGNDLSGTTEFGNYKYKLYSESGGVKKGRIKGFLRSRGALELVRSILEKEVK